MSNRDAGKGDTYRPVDYDKWDINYRRSLVNKTYTRCTTCAGTGRIDGDKFRACRMCGGIGKVEQ